MVDSFSGIKYICLECGLVFEEPKEHGEDTPAGIYHYYGCPKCTGAYRPAKQCDACMKWKLEETGEYVDSDFICEECSQELEIID